MSHNQEPTRSGWLERFFAWLGGLFGGHQQPVVETPPPIKETPPPIEETPPPAAETPPPIRETPPTAGGPETDDGLSGGEIMGVVGAFKPTLSAVAPQNFLLCDGQVLDIDDHLALFAVIGARFGGDGIETFLLPDIAGDVPFVVCAAGYFPLSGATPAGWPSASAAETLIERRVRAFRDCYGQGGDPFGDHRHMSELDPEWSERQAQNMIDAYAQGHDPLAGHAHVDDLDPQWLERQAQVLVDGYGQGRDPLQGHTHVNDLDPEWLERQAQVMSDAYGGGEDPHFRHAHVDELDPEWLERHSQVVEDAHNRGVNPHQRHAHVDELDPVWLERQAQVLQDAYAQGHDPHFRHPTPAEAEDEINERVAALLALHAEGADPLATMISPSPAATPVEAGLSAAGPPEAGLSAAGPPEAGLSAAGPPEAGLSAAGPPEAGLSAAGPPEAGLSADDLTRIEGIGPKIAAALQGAGIRTYTQLASAPLAKVEALMVQEGYRLADPTTWPEQAALAAAGQWDELEALQADLIGGRHD